MTTDYSLHAAAAARTAAIEYGRSELAALGSELQRRCAEDAIFAAQRAAAALEVAGLGRHDVSREDAALAEVGA